MSFNPNTKIAVTGGAGYIGSFVVKHLQSQGFNNLVILDNFSSGHRETAYSRFIEVDLLDKNKLTDIFTQEKFDAVIHFAAKIVVPHSMERPYEYFHHNINTSLNLLETMRETGVKNIVFSSTGSVYGTPEKLPLVETHPLNPENVYSETKVMIEKIIYWYMKIMGGNYAILRYFNACGSDAQGTHGEDHQPETHLIALACRHILNNEPIEITGNDYETPDGTGIRDYVHVEDLASAHLLALKHIMDNNKSDIFNLGTGQGHSALEVAQAIVKIAKESGYDGRYEFKPRRPGDVASIYADNNKARTVLGWNPVHIDIHEMVAGSFRWHMKQLSVGKKT